MGNTYSLLGRDWVKRIPVLLLVLLLLPTTVLSSSGRSTPNLYVTVYGDSVTVRWQVLAILQEDSDFRDKCDEVRIAVSSKNNYDRKLEKVLEQYLTAQITALLGYEVWVTDLSLHITGDGKNYWKKKMDTSVEFTLRGVHASSENGTVVDMRWLNLKLDDSKLRYEVKERPKDEYSFEPKIMLIINWRDSFGKWDLTTREPQEDGDGIFLRLPGRKDYRPFKEYNIDCSPDIALLELRVSDKTAEFRTDYIYLPSPPEPVGFFGYWKQVILGAVKSLTAKYGFILKVAISVAVILVAAYILSVRKGSWTQIMKALSEDAGKIAVSKKIVKDISKGAELKRSRFQRLREKLDKIIRGNWR